ncbi:MAG: 1-deoxy-D-xylulose-5-phosphate synthase [Clostridiales Family XIII bacterium]|jgi:1-deoxy-D-xylulose-5-phosphate synthase|nr:1-deoxy-D-xylulose-5-phosphate synthase [Clostridiales Family XIII bacterium]
MLKKNITDYNFPQDLADMSIDELRLLSYEIRDFLIHSVAETGGHLAPNLGVVELSIALHRVFDVSRDKIVWDVGHQSYVHKILTGRADKFGTLRQYGGISGFPKSAESVTDIYNSGHSSTSISAAMGLAEARDILNQDHNVIAVIGDGAMTGGLAYEGLNNAGSSKTRMIVILNDNEMSISPNTGSISHHLRKLRSSKTYIDMKKSLSRTLPRIPGVGLPLYHGLTTARNTLRSAVITESIFADLGFTYYGPVDGHNIEDLIQNLELAKMIDAPVLIHVMTKKGKGYKNAELRPGKFHGIGPFDAETGIELARPDGASWSHIAGGAISAAAENDPRVVAITAAMTDGVGLTDFARKFPERFFDVGIAEQHAVASAAGLALGGLRPFVFCYSSFLQRAYDQILMEVALQNLPVVFMVDRAGCVGQDGETHHGLFDLSYLGHMPNMTVYAPSCEEALRAAVSEAMRAGEPAAIRYPRGSAVSFPAATRALRADSGAFWRLRDGNDLTLLSAGKMTPVALEAAEKLAANGLDAAVVDMFRLKPLDENGIAGLLAKGKPVITLEDNVISGGFGEKVASFIETGGFNNKVHIIAWPDGFLTHGSVADLMTADGLDAEGVTAKVKAFTGYGRD